MTGISRRRLLPWDCKTLTKRYSSLQVRWWKGSCVWQLKRDDARIFGRFFKQNVENNWVLHEKQWFSIICTIQLYICSRMHWKSILVAVRCQQWYGTLETKLQRVLKQCTIRKTFRFPPDTMVISIFSLLNQYKRNIYICFSWLRY